MSLNDAALLLVGVAFLFWLQALVMTLTHTAKHGLNVPLPRDEWLRILRRAVMCLLAAGVLTMFGAGQ